MLVHDAVKRPQRHRASLTAGDTPYFSYMIDGSLERVVVSNEYHSKTRLCSIIGGWEEKGDSSPRRLALKDETHTLEAS